jgi:hypothetical protein
MSANICLSGCCISDKVQFIYFCSHGIHGGRRAAVAG